MKLAAAARYKLWIAIGFFVAGNLFWLSASAPGVLSPDSLETWRQIQSWNFNNWHPVTFSIWVWLTSGFGYSIFYAVIFQSFLFSCSVVCVFKAIFKDKSWTYAIFCGGILELTPFVGQMGVTLWKDVPYTAFILLAFSLYALGKSQIRFILIILLVSIGSTFRHDGVYLILLLLIVVTIFYFKNKIYNLINTATVQHFKVLALSLMVAVLINHSAPIILNAIPTTQFMKFGPLLQDLSATYQLESSSFPSSGGALISSYISGDAATGALDCERWDIMAMSTGVDTNLINESGIEIPKLWIRTLFSKSGDTLLRAHFCRSQAFLPGFFIPNNWVWTYFAIDPNNLGISRNALSQTFDVASRIDQAFSLFGKFLGWPGFYFNLLIFCSLYYRKKTILSKNTIYLLIIIGSVRAVLNSLYTTGPYYRYGLLTQISGIIVVWHVLYYRTYNYFKGLP